MDALLAELFGIAARCDAATAGATLGAAGAVMLPGLTRRPADPGPQLVQERPGFHLDIAGDVRSSGRHAAQLAVQRYRLWQERGPDAGDPAFRRSHFTIAVGGGNTVKNVYHALVQHHFREVDWLDSVRFFFLEETWNAPGWESARDALVINLIEPLTARLIASRGARRLAEDLDLPAEAGRAELLAGVIRRMVHPIDGSAINRSLRDGDRELALRQSRGEARRYQALLKELLGPSLAFHLILSGMGKRGDIAAFAPYTPELRRRKPGVLVLDRESGALSVALSRGVLTGAECVILILAGSLKLRALGRFEMDDSAGFERTVMETPVRMLRETRDIAERVYLFADERALHFEEEVFHYRARGESLSIRSEVREGEQPDGIHTLLVHGFMGLYSYVNLLVGLPSDWKVSAMHRGSRAKTLPDDEVFPHYAYALRKMILRNWKAGRPTPVCCHSMAGLISDHLLVSVLDGYGEALPPFEKLRSEDQRLIEALRTGGLIHIATFAPSDLPHLKQNVENLRRYRKQDQPFHFDPPESIYREGPDGALELQDEHREGLIAMPESLARLVGFRGTAWAVGALNLLLRSSLGRIDVQQFMPQKEEPYGKRLLGARVLRKVSFYGVLKEISAAIHRPLENQQRHLRALEVIAHYDIPLLVIIHKYDLMVSANRHLEEHAHLLAARKAKEGVGSKRDLTVPASLLLLGTDEEEAPVDLIDPHFLILSSTPEDGGNARKVTAAITRFVNDNVARSQESAAWTAVSRAQ